VQVPPADETGLPEPPSGLAVDAGLQLELSEVPADESADPEPQQTAPISHPAVAEEPPKVGNGVLGGNGQGSDNAAPAASESTGPEAQLSSVQVALGEMMGDAPLCDVCGHITIRNGSCYKCLNCGHSMGCS
jgi:hypothetical protein